MGVASTLAVVIVLAAFLNVSWGMYSEEGMCFCAVFRTKNTNSEHIMAPTPQIEVTCDKEGKTHCRNMCIRMAQVVREKTRQALFEYLDRGLNIVTPAIFSKICDGDYEYTGLTL